MQSFTVKQFIDGEFDTEKDVYISTWAGMQKVTGIRWPETNPWIVCGEENAGYGLSYSVHYGMLLYQFDSIKSEKVASYGYTQGWKFFIDGVKFPKQRGHFYTELNERIAKGIALTEAHALN